MLVVLPLHLKNRGVGSAGRGQWQTGVSGQAVLRVRALFLREGMEGGVSSTAHPVQGDDPQRSHSLLRDQTGWGKSYQEIYLESFT